VAGMQSPPDWHAPVTRCSERPSSLGRDRVNSAADNTLGVTPRSLRSLARQVVKGVAWEGPGTSFAALSVGSGGS